MQHSNSVGKLKELADKLRLRQPVYTSELISGSWRVQVCLELPDGTAPSASAHAGDKRQAKATAADNLLCLLQHQYGLQVHRLPHLNPNQKGRLRELITRSRSGLQVYYTEPSVTGTISKPLWQSSVHILSAAGTLLLTAAAISTSKVGSHEAAAAKLLSGKQLYSLALAPAPSVVGAAASLDQASPTNPAATGKQAIAASTADQSAAPCSGHKSHLQELLQIAASKHLPGWQGQVPQYSSTSSGLPDCVQHVGQVIAVGPAGQLLTATSTPMPTKKQAEQAAAAALLQLPQLQQLQVALQKLQHQSKAGDTYLHQLMQLVQQAGWCAEDVEHVSTPDQYSAVFEARIVINGHLLGRGWGESKSAASQAAAHMVLASMGLTPPPQGTTATVVDMAEAAATNHMHAAVAWAYANNPTEQAPAYPAALPPHSMQPIAYRLPPTWSQPAQGLPNMPPPPPPPSLPYVPTLPTAAAAAGKPPFPTIIQQLSLQKFNELVVSALSVGAVSAAAANGTVISTFLLQQGNTEPEVIALGTGTGFCSLPDHCITSSERCGKLLLDSHAEIIARRSLLRWLYQQAQVALDTAEHPGRNSAAAAQTALEVLPHSCATATTPAHQSGFKGISSSSSGNSAGIRLRLKPGYKIHMYVSKVPCGDARDFKKPAHSSISSTTKHCSNARPRMQLAVPSTAAYCTWQQQSVALPSQQAISSHWPLGSVVLNPKNTGGNQGRLRGKVLCGEVCVPLPRAVTAAAPIRMGCRSNISASSRISSGGSLTDMCSDTNNSSSRTSSSATSMTISRFSSSSNSSLTPSDDSNYSDSGGNRKHFPIRKVCCSDKLARFNALGLQGALLGQWLEPVYISSITVGGSAASYCEGAVSRAVCCRLAPDLSTVPLRLNPGPPPPRHHSAYGRQQSHSEPLQQQRHSTTRQQHSAGPANRQSWPACGMYHPPSAPRMAAAVERGLKLQAPYRVNHPQLLYAPEVPGVPVPGGHGTSRASADETLNWNAAEAHLLEITSGTGGAKLNCLSITEDPEVSAHSASYIQAVMAGGCVVAGGASRLSKLGLFKCYTKLQQRDAAGQCSSAAEGMTYASAKALNSGYNAAKQQLYCHFEQTLGQSWMRRSELLPELESWLI